MEDRRVRQEAVRDMAVRRCDSMTILVGNAMHWLKRLCSHLGKTLLALALKEAASWIDRKKDTEITKIMSATTMNPQPLATAQRNLYGNNTYPPPAPVSNPYGNSPYESSYRPSANTFPGFNS